MIFISFGAREQKLLYKSPFLVQQVKTSYTKENIFFLL